MGSEGSGNKAPRRLKPVRGEQENVGGLGKAACQLSLLQQPCLQPCAPTLRTDKRHFRGQHCPLEETALILIPAAAAGHLLGTEQELRKHRIASMGNRPEDGDCCCLRWSVGPEGSTVGWEDATSRDWVSWTLRSLSPGQLKFSKITTNLTSSAAGGHHATQTQAQDGCRLDLLTQSHPVPSQFFADWLPAFQERRLGESAIPCALLTTDCSQAWLLSFQAV